MEQRRMPLAEGRERRPASVLKSGQAEFDAHLPPPNPLLPKTFVPSDPAIFAQDLPFE